jgi:hypothetical protein
MHAGRCVRRRVHTPSFVRMRMCACVQVRLQLLQSFVPEAHKALRLVLSNPEGGAALGKRSTCKVTLVRRQFTLLPSAAQKVRTCRSACMRGWRVVIVG